LRVDWLIPCRYVEVNNGLATLVGAGIEWQTVPAFPIEFTQMLGLRIVGLPDEEEHTLNVRILGPTMEPAGETLEATFRMGQGPGHAEG
jgi:hypothetical protein